MASVPVADIAVGRPRRLRPREAAIDCPRKKPASRIFARGGDAPAAPAGNPSSRARTSTAGACTSSRVLPACPAGPRQLSAMSCRAPALLADGLRIAEFRRRLCARHSIVVGRSSLLTRSSLGLRRWSCRFTGSTNDQPQLRTSGRRVLRRRAAKVEETEMVGG